MTENTHDKGLVEELVDVAGRIRVFAQDAMDMGHDRGTLGNLMAIRDDASALIADYVPRLADALLASSERADRMERALRAMRDATVYQSACRATKSVAVHRAADAKFKAALALADAALSIEGERHG